MVVTHLDIVSERRSVLIVVIEKGNLERMKKADPLTLECRKLGGTILPRVMFPEELSLLVAYEEDDAELYRICKSNNALALLSYLDRGRVFDPATDGPENMATYKGAAK